MKKRFLVYLALLSFTTCAFGAQYKINSKGQVKNPEGQIQQKSNVTAPVYYNNYQQQEYVDNKVVLKDNIKTIDIVMDYSGSMYYWIETAKSAMRSIISQVPQGVNLGFRIFGNDSGKNPYNPIVSAVSAVKKDNKGKYKVTTTTNSYLGDTRSSCSATSSLVSVSPLDYLYIVKKMNQTKVGGMTPLTLALHQSVQYDFSGMDTINKKKIVLITDGGENCGGDPCAFAKDLMSRRQDIVIDVVLVSSSSKSLQCLASITGGKIYNPADGGEFVKSITNSLSGADENTQNDDTNGQYYEFDPND